MRKIIAETQTLPEADAAHPGTSFRCALRVTLPEGYHMQSNRPLKPLLVPTSLQSELPTGIEITELVYPNTIELTQEDVEGTLAVFEREYPLGIMLKLAPSVQPGNVEIPLTLRYQPCDEGMCYPPVNVKTSLSLKVAPPETPQVPQNASLMESIPFGKGLPPATASAAALIPADPSVETPISGDALPLDRFTLAATAGGYLNTEEMLAFLKRAESGAASSGPFEGRGPIFIVLMVLLGGFALNLTPCVLPMIPINLAIIGAGSQAGSKRRGMWLGAVYGLAMALVYGLLGLVVILTAGTFGTLNSSPWFNLGIAVLFVFLGLAMFDVVVVDFSRFSGKFGSGGKSGSVVLAFSMGAVAALLAGACVAPVVIQVVLFSSKLYADGTRIALALPFVLGLGMAIPWPIAGAGLSALPKPGAWMARVKQVFGLLIIGSAFYYGYLGCSSFVTRTSSDSTSMISAEGWYDSIDKGLAAAEREQKPVFIDMWASWCKNCATMEHTTFRDKKVNAALAGYVKIKFAAEKPDEEPAKSLCKRFNAVGLPTFVILTPKRPQP